MHRTRILIVLILGLLAAVIVGAPAQAQDLYRSSESTIDGEPTDFYVADAIAATLAGEPVDPAETRAHGCSVKYN